MSDVALNPASMVRGLPKNGELKIKTDNEGQIESFSFIRLANPETSGGGSSNGATNGGTRGADAPPETSASLTRRISPPGPTRPSLDDQLLDVIIQLLQVVLNQSQNWFSGFGRPNIGPGRPIGLPVSWTPPWRQGTNIVSQIFGNNPFGFLPNFDNSVLSGGTTRSAGIISLLTNGGFPVSMGTGGANIAAGGNSPGGNIIAQLTNGGFPVVGANGGANIATGGNSPAGNIIGQLTNGGFPTVGPNGGVNIATGGNSPAGNIIGQFTNGGLPIPQGNAGIDLLSGGNTPAGNIIGQLGNGNVAPQVNPGINFQGVGNPTGAPFVGQGQPGTPLGQPGIRPGQATGIRPIIPRQGIAGNPGIQPNLQQARGIIPQQRQLGIE
jgi:hypothetical protein